jgi:pimeloyl-ACP methyl ester carboxylesterase
MTTPLLILSGAGLPASTWDAVRARLDGESRVVASPGRDGTLASYAEAALRAADGWPRFHLVAHSLGGAVAGAVVAAEPSRVARLTGVAAIVPRAGRSFTGALPLPGRFVMGAVVRVLGTKPPASALRAMCAGLSEEDTERVVGGFAPEGRRVYLDRTPPRTWPEHASYVVTTRDDQFPRELQERYAAELAADVRTIDTGHLPMLERPAELAALLAQAS